MRAAWSKVFSAGGWAPPLAVEAIGYCYGVRGSPRPLWLMAEAHAATEFHREGPLPGDTRLDSAGILLQAADAWAEAVDPTEPMPHLRKAAKRIRQRAVRDWQRGAMAG